MDEKSTREIFFPDLYFQSGGKRIDYIIVYNIKQILSTEGRKNAFANFLEYLVDRSIHLEQVVYTKNEDINFIKIHVPHEILEGFADANNIDLAFKTSRIRMIYKVNRCKFRRNALSYDNEYSSVFHRAKETISRKRPKKMTQAERILITYNILQQAAFGSGVHDKGLQRLEAKKIIEDSFPLHEGPPFLTPTGPLTDRQLLAAFWGDLRNFTKEQPTDIIEKYFGPELAFYFAFVEFCNKMLIVASLVSIFFFILGYLVDYDYLVLIREDICKTEEYVCAFCNPDYCPLVPLKKFCKHFKESHLYDNIGTFLLSIFMSLWGTLFFELWKRKRNLFNIKWHLMNVQYDVSLRTGYEEQADISVISPVTGELEPAMSRSSVFWRNLVTALIMFSLIGFVLFFVALSIMVKKFSSMTITQYVHIKFLRSNSKFLVNCIGALAQVIFIVIIDRVVKPSVRFMTYLENCRTQIEYDNSFITKLWILSFVNQFAGLFYSAFVKGAFYTNPGDQRIYEFYNPAGDICMPAGCNQELIILLTFYLVVKTLLVKCIRKVFLPLMKNVFRKDRNKRRKRNVQWEEDYPLHPLTNLSIPLEYSEIVGRLTLVLFFTAVFPFVPLITYFCNFVEEKVDANMFVNSKRRPNPRKVNGLGAWYYIIYLLIIIGVSINALTSILTKNYFFSSHYAYYYGPLDQYVKRKFSKFAISDYKTENIKHQVENLTYCVYNKPFRYPPGHPRKYDLSPEYFPTIAFAACFIVIYQHVVFLLSRLLSRVFPNVSADVKEHVHFQEAENKKLIRKHRNQEYIGRRASAVQGNSKTH